MDDYENDDMNDNNLSYSKMLHIIENSDHEDDTDTVSS